MMDFDSLFTLFHKTPSCHSSAEFLLYLEDYH